MSRSNSEGSRATADPSPTGHGAVHCRVLPEGAISTWLLRLREGAAGLAGLAPEPFVQALVTDDAAGLE
ncbi:hypothetical protein [Brevundimonas sp.]|uniref:hypothetical protein n=1 Tax=Brevundimonas sp. TaxID=1871086 RepID=UPI00289F4C85|nr:hypothetical protein [Brevundimonas sp.]